MSLNRDPAFFTFADHAAPGFVHPDRQRIKIIDGRRVTIKHPQSAHLGEYDGFVRTAGEGVRWISTVDSAGNVVFYVITSGAADRNANSEYAQERKQKARFLGWFPVAECPLRTLSRNQFVERSLVGQPSCDGGTVDEPCEHALAEIAARRAAHNAIEAARPNPQSATDKIVAAQSEQTQQLVAALTAALTAKSSMDAAAIAELVAAIQSGKPEKPEKQKKGEG